MAQFSLIRPVTDNARAFRDLFTPGAVYLGDIGDAAHLAGSGDHTPWASDVIFGRRDTSLPCAVPVWPDTPGMRAP